MSRLGRNFEMIDGETIDTPARSTSSYHVLYPGIYVWYVFISALDVMFTWVVLHFDGEEVNQVANAVLMKWDLPGIVVFKFVLVTLVICICEFVGRQRPKLGQYLGEWAVGITCIPVLLAALQLIAASPLD